MQELAAARKAAARCFKMDLHVTHCTITLGSPRLADDRLGEAALSDYRVHDHNEKGHTHTENCQSIMTGPPQKLAGKMRAAFQLVRTTR